VIAAKLAELQNEKWASFLRNLHPNNAPLWKLTRYFKTPQNSIPPLFHNGRQFYEAESKADLLGDYFASTHWQTIPQKSKRHSRMVDRTVGRFLTLQRHGDNDFPLISHTDVQRHIKALKQRTSPGKDGISNTLIRHFSKDTIRHLSYIFNASLQFGYFPNTWKHATLLAIPKPQKPPSDPGSYRPISLLSALSKLMERIVANRLANYAQQKSLIPDEQFGFRKRHSTVAQLIRLTDYVTHGFNINRHTGLVMLDVEKTYDTVLYYYIK
jgi:hypothetical protein